MTSGWLVYRAGRQR